MAIPTRPAGWPLWSILLGASILVALAVGFIYLGRTWDPLTALLSFLGRTRHEREAQPPVQPASFIPEQNGATRVHLPTLDENYLKEQKRLAKLLEDEQMTNRKILEELAALRQRKTSGEKESSERKAAEKPKPLKVSAPTTLTLLPGEVADVPAHQTSAHAGTVIHCTTKNRVNTERQRTMVATVTQHVRDSRDPNVVLIPQWSQAIMDTDPQALIAGDARYPAALTRIQLPNGHPIDLPRLPLYDGIGQGGLTGDIDNKLGWLIKGALFRGAMAASVASVREVSPGAINAGLGPAAQVGRQVTAPYVNVKPTIISDESSLCAFILETPLSLPPYTFAEARP